MPDARRSHKNIVEHSTMPYVHENAGKEEVIFQEPSKTIPVRLLKNLVVKVISDITGKEYVFNGAGSVVSIDISDLEIIRRKNQAHKTCCGGLSSPYFEIL